MEYVKAYSQPPRGPLMLEDDVSRESVAGECRDAALAFVTGVSSGWDKLDLVLWLTGPYAVATRHAGRGERVADLDADAEVDDEWVESLVGEVRGDLLASLEEASHDGGMLGFVEASVDANHVRRALDADGLEVWVPVDMSRMRLLDRVRTLFAADYLNDAALYEELFVCPRCESVVFDEGARRVGFCGAHRRVSGIVPREDGTVPKVAGDD
jgi:hypothetical protein